MTPTREELDALHGRMTKGEWAVDTERNDSAYGSGPDHGTGFDDYFIGTEVNGKWETLLCTDNATLKEVEEDYDEDWHGAWDRIGKANAAGIVALKNAWPAVSAELAALREEVARLTAERDAAKAEIAQVVAAECLTSPTGRHIVDTSMESGPNNCFHCELPMPKAGEHKGDR